MSFGRWIAGFVNTYSIDSAVVTHPSCNVVFNEISQLDVFGDVGCNSWLMI